MEFVAGCVGRKKDIAELFSVTFSASEGIEEGRVVSELASDLMETTPNEDLLVCSAIDAGLLVGCIVFSRLTFERDDREVFILSPVAVLPGRQKQGVGQELIAFGLAELKRKGVDVVVTYGDPNYYSKVGFGHMTENFVRAPFALTQPQGWLGQSLSSEAMEPLAGPSRCVEALNKQELW